MSRKPYAVGLCLMVLILFFSFYACNKKDSRLTKDSEEKSAKQKTDLAEARSWFESKHKKNANSLLLMSTDRAGEANLVTDSYPLTTGSFAGTPPDWNDKRPNKNGSVNIALSNGILPGTSIQYFRDIIIGKGKDGKYKEVIEHVEFDSAYLHHQITAKGDLPHIRAYVDGKTFTGKIAYYTLNNRFVKGVIMKNGIVVKTLSPDSELKAKVLASVGGASRLPRTYASSGGEDSGIVDDPDLPDIILPPGDSPGFPDPFPFPEIPTPDIPLPEEPKDPFADEDWGPPPGGDYGPAPTPKPTPNDPCSKAKEMKDKATEQTKTEQYADALNKIKAAGSANGKEHAIVLNKNGVPSQVFSGGENSVGSSVTENAVAGMHNHPNAMPPSAGDVYTLINRNQRYPGFATSFVVLPGGQVYALVVTDPAAAAAFSRTYPPQYADANSAPNFEQDVQDKFNDCKEERNVLGSLSQEEANFIAMSYVLDTYNSGIAVLKQDANGNFVKQQVQASKNHVGDDVYSASNCP